MDTTKTTPDTSGVASRIGLGLFGMLWLLGAATLGLIGIQRVAHHWFEGALSFASAMLLLVIGALLVWCAVSGAVPAWWRQLLLHLSRLQD